jgi:hypothetical protein
MIFLIFLAIFLWLGGYMMTARFMSTTGVLGDDSEKLITPPKWLYYLCGAPVSNGYPKGAMRVAALQSQMGGIFLGIYILWYVITRPTTSINALGFGLCMLVSYLVSTYVSKRYAVNHRSRIHNGRK